MTRSNAGARTLVVGLLAVLSLGLIAPPAGAATGDVSEFTVPTAMSLPQGIAVGSDGALWFAERSANDIGRPGERCDLRVPPSERRLGAVLGDGRSGRQRVVHGALGEPDRQHHAGGSHHGIPSPHREQPAGGDHDRSGRCPLVRRADRQPDRTHHDRWTGHRVPAAPCVVRAVGDHRRSRRCPVVHRVDRQPDRSDHDRWAGHRVPVPVLEPPGDRHHRWWRRKPVVHRTCGQRGRPDHYRWIDRRVRRPASLPNLVGIAAGPDGNVWFAELGGNNLGRITPDGTITEFPLPNPSSQPFAIAQGTDGAMWFTEALGNRIGRMQVQTAPPPTRPRRP